MDKDSKENRPKNGIKTAKYFYVDLAANITMLDLSNRKIETFNDNFSFPPNLTELFLTKNYLCEIPMQVLNLSNLKMLDVSFNKIEYFDDIPKFCHTIEYLNISNNKLFGPPYWIWSEEPKNLINLDVSYNEHLTNSFVNGYMEELLQYKTLVTRVKINNCQLTKHIQFLSTLSKVKHLELGSNDLNKHAYINKLEEVPCKGLEECCDIETISLSNTYIYYIKSSIDIFKNLRELDLSQNKLNGLPNEIGNLDKLEVFILSQNAIMYLPDNFTRLKNLVTLLIDSNELCMLPDDICDLPHLKTLDLYDNKLYDIPHGIEKIVEIDLAQNYFKEPKDEDYIQKKNAIRQQKVDRLDDCKEESEVSESYKSDNSSEYELTLSNEKEDCDTTNRPLSSPEDWDSDDHWIPHYFCPTKPSRSAWITYVERKMAEGNFCPMDAHIVSVYEKVKYEKALNPQIRYECEGQFDDYSEDDS